MTHETIRPATGRARRGGSLVRMSRTFAMSLMLLLAMGVGIGLDRLAIHTGLVDASSQLTTAENFQILEETYDAIRNNYVLEEEISDEELVYGAARGMVEALGDTNHSRFLDPEEAIQFEQSSRGELVGIGIQIDTEATPPMVIAPIPNSPAFEAGILPGDVILAVDGMPTSEMTTEEVGNNIRGEEGTDVVLTLRHAGETEPYEVTITRAKIEVPAVDWAMLPNGVLWIQLSGFTVGATEEVQEALRQGEEMGMTGVILDLRNNGGGLVFEAMGIASQFLPDGTPLFQEVDAEGEKQTISTVGSNGLYQEGPMVVLVNEYSASASEIVSSALKESGRAPLLGETTSGTGTVLLPFELSDGSIALLGTELWLTGQGNDVYKKGVTPTEEIFLPEGDYPAQPILVEGADEDRMVTEEEFEAVEDNQLQAAWDTLQSRQP